MIRKEKGMVKSFKREKNIKLNAFKSFLEMKNQMHEHIYNTKTIIDILGNKN